MAFLTRDQIIAADDRKYETVSCPEWGGDVRLKSISGTQRDAYESSVIAAGSSDKRMNLRNARAKLIILCAVDDNGAQLFTTDDLNALGRKNAAPIDRLFDACRKLAGMSENDVDALTEDFGATPTDDAISD